MGRFRINWFDLVGRALNVAAQEAQAVGQPVPTDVQVARAIEALSASYRAGQAPRHGRPEARAAYLWHHLPAHVSDLARLFMDLPELYLERERLALLDLGAGPGTGLLALLDAISATQERGLARELRRLEATHAERERSWEQSLRVLLPVALDALRQRAPGLLPEGVEVGKALRADLTQPPSERLLAAWEGADLVLAANLVSEVPPRGSEELPAGLEQTFRTLFARVEGETALLLVDRAGAPGVRARLAEVCRLAEESGATLRGPKERSTRCGDALTRRAKAIYRHVKFPTTQNADEPVRNCRSLWALLRWA